MDKYLQDIKYIAHGKVLLQFGNKNNFEHFLKYSTILWKNHFGIPGGNGE